MQRLLTQETDELLRRERALLEGLRVHVARLDAREEDLALLKRSLAQLDELFLLVVVGEFNAGKTAFINALLGERLLKEGVTPTTSNINVIRYGDTLHQEQRENDYLVVYAPVDWLREFSLVDTPGTNAVIQRHQEITEQFVPRSDLILFVTSADRPFSESERTFLTRVREWGKKIVIVVNKIDLIEDDADRVQILDFVRDNARQLLGMEPQIFPVSARLALQAKSVNANGHPDADRWQASNFAALEDYVLETLDARARLLLKLQNPLGVADRLIAGYEQVIRNRQDVLQGDFRTLDTIDENLQAYQDDMRRDFAYHRNSVDNVLYAMAERGDKFFDDTLRITRVFDLMNSSKIQAAFDREVIADTSREIEREVSSLIDWLVDKDYRQWRAIMDYLNQRAAEHADQIVGQVGSEFEFNRQNLLASVGREAHKIVNTYDRDAESRKLGQQVQRAIIQTAALEAGALGLGAILVAVLQTTMLDVTGIIGASAVAAMGLYVLPYRRGKVKAELRGKINALRDQLNSVLNTQFESELGDSVQRIREAIAPYTRFVRVEREKLEKLAATLEADRAELDALRHAVDRIADAQ
ncbi:MAG: dynamin family protein [Caldilineaceae bacterium]|nr:dynamin family protein [Caldilineaceae bacterium]